MATKPIVGFESRYTISDSGEVFSLLSQQYLQCSVCTQGYPVAKLYAGSCPQTGKGKWTYRRVHRLVALHFIPNPAALPVVNHLDGNKLNNSMHNLEWCTHAQNSAHAFATGLTPKKLPTLAPEQLQDCQYKYSQGVSIKDLADFYGVSRSAIERNIELSPEGRAIQLSRRGSVTGAAMAKRVAQLSLEGEVIKEWDSTIAAAKALGIRQGSISNVCVGRTKTAGGFRWARL